MSQGSRDNMSLVLITLPGAPKVSEEALKKEQILEELIEKKVTGNMLTTFCMCYHYLIVCVLIFTWENQACSQEKNDLYAVWEMFYILSFSIGMVFELEMVLQRCVNARNPSA